MILQEIINNPAKIVLAVIIVDIIAVLLARNNLAGQVIKEWYNKFSLGAFIADVSSILFGIFLALFLFKYVLPAEWFNLWTLFLTVVIIQLAHDLTFAYIIQKTPANQNNMIDVFKKYVDENSWKILLVDASMMIGSVLLVYLFYNVDNVIIYTLLAFLIYIVQFFIY